ncbi:hypothetical protein GGI42DRAFT_232810 [Trichoderma sp. SZMC 28013]
MHTSLFKHQVRTSVQYAYISLILAAGKMAVFFFYNSLTTGTLLRTHTVPSCLRRRYISRCVYGCRLGTSTCITPYSATLVIPKHHDWHNISFIYPFSSLLSHSASKRGHCKTSSRADGTKTHHL